MTSLHVTMVTVFLAAGDVMETTTAVTDRTNVNVVINFVLLYRCIDVDFAISHFTKAGIVTVANGLNMKKQGKQCIQRCTRCERFRVQASW